MLVIKIKLYKKKYFDNNIETFIQPRDGLLLAPISGGCILTIGDNLKCMY